MTALPEPWATTGSMTTTGTEGEWSVSVECLDWDSEKRIQLAAIQDHGTLHEPGRTLLAIDCNAIAIATAGKQDALSRVHDADNDEIRLCQHDPILTWFYQRGANDMPIALRLVDVGVA